MLVLFPLEFLSNIHVAKPVRNVLNATGVKNLTLTMEEYEDAKTKLNLEVAIPPSHASKPWKGL